jgi:VWFA-related protein
MTGARRIRGLAGLAGAVTLLAGPPIAGHQDQNTFRLSTDAVRVDVSVRDGAKVITGLGAKDFEVYDSGVLQNIADVSYGKLPIDVSVALDVSLSVTGPMLDSLRRAILQLMRDLGPDDRLKLLTFNMRVSRPVDFTTDPSEVERAIRAATASGGTSVWDAIAIALVSKAPPDRRQLVVLFTDGADSSSASTPAMLVDVAQRSNASVTSVLPAGVVQQAGRGDPQSRLLTLSKIGAETGGTVIPVGTDLTATFKRALDEFRSSYVLHFVPRGVERHGFHVLEVKIKDKPKLAIRARRGYFAD